MNKYELTAEQIGENWDNFLNIIKKDFPTRSEALLEFYNLYEDRLILLPASSKNFHHNCIPGGYIDHILRVRECALKLYDMWKEMGADMSTYTKEELSFVALHHDFGKFGTLDEESYVPNDSQWHVKNQGAVYKINNKMGYMSVPDRGLFLLQDIGIPLSLNEWLGIKIHDGLYDKGNEYYFMAQTSETSLRSHLAILIHHADHMAARIEKEKWMKIEQPLDKKPVKTYGTRKNWKKEYKPVTKETTKQKNVFNALFNED